MPGSKGPFRISALDTFLFLSLGSLECTLGFQDYTFHQPFMYKMCVNVKLSVFLHDYTSGYVSLVYKMANASCELPGLRES